MCDIVGVDCPEGADITSLDNGETVYNCTVFECEVLYVCNTGYNLSGVALRTCQADSTWSGTAPTCTSMSSYCLQCTVITLAQDLV